MLVLVYIQPNRRERWTRLYVIVNCVLDVVVGRHGVSVDGGGGLVGFFGFCICMRYLVVCVKGLAIILI